MISKLFIFSREVKARREIAKRHRLKLSGSRSEQLISGVEFQADILTDSRRRRVISNLKLTDAYQKLTQLNQNVKFMLNSLEGTKEGTTYGNTKLNNNRNSFIIELNSDVFKQTGTASGLKLAQTILHELIHVNIMLQYMEDEQISSLSQLGKDTELLGSRQHSNFYDKYIRLSSGTNGPRYIELLEQGLIEFDSIHGKPSNRKGSVTIDAGESVNFTEQELYEALSWSGLELSGSFNGIINQPPHIAQTTYGVKLNRRALVIREIIKTQL